eukprot:scaffold4384_cov183-Skeletonema_marinoi.AAC.5
MERGPPSPSLSFKLSMSKWTPECDGHLLALVTGFTENGQNPAFTAIAEHLNSLCTQRTLFSFFSIQLTVFF